MATTNAGTITKPLLNQMGGSIDANYGPWASTEEYVAWLNSKAKPGVTIEPKEGTLIAIADNGEVKLMVYQADGQWKSVGMDESGFSLVYAPNMIQVKYADHVLFNIAVGDEEEAGLISPIDLRNLQYVYDKVGSGTIAVPVPTKNLVNAVNYLYERLKNAGTGGDAEAIKVAKLVADRLYISQNPGGATVYLCVGDMPDKQNDIECFTIDCVDSDVDNYAGLMSVSDKIKLDGMKGRMDSIDENVDSLSQKVEEAVDATNRINTQNAMLEELARQAIEKGTADALAAGIAKNAGDIKALEDIVVEEDGYFFVDEGMNIGVKIDNNGLHAINLIEFEVVS